MASIADLIRSGALVPVQVFGGDADKAGDTGTQHCQKCHADVPWGYGLCDRFSRFKPGGSDCNRAEFFLLRPNDLGHQGAEVQDMEAIRTAIQEVLDDE